MPLDRAARIGVVGAGPAGLTAAEALRALGLGRVVVFEAQHRVGGKCCSIPRPGTRRRALEAGTLFFEPGPGWAGALAGHPPGLRVVSSPPLRLADLRTGTTSDPLLGAGSRHSMWARAAQTARFAAHVRRVRRSLGPAIGPEVPAELAQAMGPYLATLGLPFVREVLVPATTAAQLGPLAETLPALYALRLFALLDRVGLLRQLTLRMPQLAFGHQDPWETVAARHDVRLGARVTSVVRGRAVEVVTSDGRATALDALFWAAPARELLAIADLDADERDVLSRVRTVARAVVFARVRGLPRGVAWVPRVGGAAVPDAHPHLVLEVDPRSDLYAFYPFLDDPATRDDTLLSNAAATVAAFGGEVLEQAAPILRWSWLPHFDAGDVAAGAHARLSAIDGRRGLFHLGELVAGIGVPQVAEHAVHAVRAAVLGTGAPGPPETGA